MAARKPSDSAALERENAELRREVATLRQRQAASADILRAIVAAPGEAEGTLQKIAETAQRLLHARGTLVALVDGDQFRQAGVAGPQADEFVDRLAGLPVDETTGIGRAVLEQRVVHLDDNRQVTHDIERGIARGRRLPPRTFLAVPLMSGAKAIGVIGVNRPRKSPFDKAEIKLLESFADQAVIAIENARLLAELRESLDRQTATAEVLGVISASPGELQPMFATILDNALRLCEAANGFVFRIEDGALHTVAHRGLPPRSAARVESGPLHPGPDTAAMEMQRTAATVHVADLRETESYRSGDPVVSAAVDESGMRTALFVPMVKDGQVVGAINVHRREVRPFSDKQIALLESFAAQAVIAIENARLLAELREALENQTASADILRAIASSPEDSAGVLDTIARTTARLFDAHGLNIRILEGGVLRYAASVGPTARRIRAGVEEGPPDPRRMSGAAIIEKRQIHIADLADPAERALWPTLALTTEDDGSAVATPLMRRGEAIGALVVLRKNARPFTDKELSQLSNFAAQAVIAIENARLLAELRESLDQQTATAEVLGVISASPGEVKPVFDIILENAMRLCEAEMGYVYRVEGGVVRPAAARNGPPGYEALLRQRGAWRPDPRTGVAEAIRRKQPLLIDDLRDHPLYAERDATIVPMVEQFGLRTLLHVPMLRDGEVIGVIILYRREVRPFARKHIDLVASFADQAVIAIENARLLAELRESLETQTASADILRTIAAFPAEADGALDAIAQTTARLFGAAGATIRTVYGERLRLAGSAGAAAEGLREAIGEETSIDPETLPGNVVLNKRPFQVPDIDHPDPDIAHWPGWAPQRAAGIRTVAGTPLMREGQAIGALIVRRSEPRPFVDKEMTQLANFADQAVIAIENARLLSELHESLERRTAMAEVLAMISSSPGEVEPVFEAMLDNAVRLCEATEGSVFRASGDVLHRIASRGLMAELGAGRDEIRVEPPTPPGRMLSTRKTVHVPDLLAELSALAGAPGMEVPTVAADRGIRSALWVPMIRDNVVVGAFVLQRREVRAFTDAQIGLVESFANQAVIAIENARLLTELRESFDRQTATSEVLRTISSSAGELDTVYAATLENATRVCAAQAGALWRFDGNEFRPVAMLGIPPAYADFLRQENVRASHPDLPIAHVARSKQAYHLLDAADCTPYLERDPVAVAAVELGGVHTVLAVPLLRENEVIGAMAIYRQDVRLFTDKQIELVENFADQAVIAIENARLLSELRTAREAAERSLGELKAAQANLIQAEKMASLGQLTAGIAHEIKNPLNFVNNFAALSVELLDELKETTGSALEALDGAKRSEIDEVVGMLTGNLEKIGEHGRRADGIVKSMLAHSRGGGGERRTVDLNALIEDALNLAYHGARAQDQDFNVTLERDLDSSLAPIEVVPQDLTRVFLNLFGNGFYAANERRMQAGDPAFEPALMVATLDRGAEVEIRIRDNGIGIAPEIRARLFEPFFTTKPTGEGTGLGLSISYEIVTRQHGGAIEVESEPGGFTEFSIRIPKRFEATAAGEDPPGSATP